MNPYQTYRKSSRTNWTRIEMLLALYRETEASIRRGIDALQLEQRDEFPLSQIRTLKLLLAILTGIHEDHDKLSRNIHKLVLFVFQQVSREDLAGLQNGLRVLVTLKESFEGIEEEANRLEADGTIPPLQFDLDGVLAIG